jgi:hypothetical protein
MTPHQIELLRCAADKNRKLPEWVSGRLPDGRALFGVAVAHELRALGFVMWPQGEREEPAWRAVTITQAGRDALAALEASDDVQH